MKAGGTRLPPWMKPSGALILRRYQLRNTSAKDILKIVKREWGNKLSFLSYDPTDNSMVVRTTEEQMQLLWEYIRRLDGNPPAG